MAKTHHRYCRDCDTRLPGWQELKDKNAPRWAMNPKYCQACCEQRARDRRAGVGERLISRAKPKGTVERAGQTFTVITLPPKKRSKR